MTEVVESGPFAGWRRLAPQLFAVLRIVAGLIIITYGTMKLFAWPVGLPPNNGTAQLMSQIGLAGVLETFGGLLILIGAFTRPVAFILSGEMAVAYFQGHFPNGFWPVQNNGTPAVLYCFYFLYLSAAGAGIWSVDAARNR
ncbi:MAG TPA: DoxX family protein [Gemmatimonadaceae bacterium]